MTSTMHRRWLGVAAAAMMVVSACGSSTAPTQAASASTAASAAGDVTVNVAIVSNPDMERLKGYAPEFEKTHPGIKLNFVTLDETTLRDQLTKNVGTSSGAYDVVMIGVLEIPNCAKNKWIDSIQSEATADTNWDIGDLIPAVKDNLSVDGQLYAAPFYAESTIIYYRKDLFAKAGLTMPAEPTWDDIAGFAQKLNDPANKVAGICLRGQKGWGGVFSGYTTMLHAYGGTIFDANYNATLNTPAAKAATTAYVNMAKNYGEPNASSASYPECLNAMSQGNAAMWYDATVAASALEDPKQAKPEVAANMGFAPAPKEVDNYGGWLWSWAFARLATSPKKDADWQFMSWATSKDYQNLIATNDGAGLIPPGTRTSLYQRADYRAAAKDYADLTLKAINTVPASIPGGAPLERSFYVAVPEWAATADVASGYLSEAIAGSISVDDALAKMQAVFAQMATDGGYKQ